MSVYEGVRKQILCSCQNPKSRRVSVEYPVDWTPGKVINPETGDLKLGFSLSSAWLFIAELVSNGCEIEEIELDIPKGKRGYVILHPMPCGRFLYVKLMFGNGGIVGRSFHYSERTFSTKLIN